MKKQLNKLSLKADQIVSLSKDVSSNILGGVPPRTGPKCDPYSNTRCTVCTWM